MIVTTLLVCLICLVSAQQNALIAPAETRITSESLAVLSHPQFPSHKVRVKRNTLCEDEKVARGYSGYLDIGSLTFFSVLTVDDDKHLFFWWFESRNDPVNDDVIMWLNGGPGCSSMTGLLMELGPCRINSYGNDTVNNPYSWTNNASIFFLDQPVGVGFSYGKQHVATTKEASHDVYAFMKIWEEAFPKYKGNSFHIAGESYGGHYVPVFATEIAKKGGFNLKSVMIGNGYFSERE